MLDLNELAQRRVKELDAMTDAQLLDKAADIIAADPIVANGSFRAFYNNQQLARALGLPVPTVAGEPKACHCLEGAMHEAAGVYYTTDETSQYGILNLVDVAFASRKQALGHYVVEQFSLGDFARLSQSDTDAGTLPNFLDIATRNYFAPSIIYVYSDYVLSKMGADGPKEAERILRAAARAAAKEQSEAAGA